jgi:general secretion pathway protein H
LRRTTGHRGFTLIELVVVMAIIALLVAVAAPAAATLTRANVKKAAGELAGTMRVLFDTAAVKHCTCRLGMDLEKRAFWAECAPGPAGVSTGSGKENDEDLARRFPDESDPEIRKVLARSTFGEFKDRMVRRRELPGKAHFGQVTLEGRREAQDSGTAYVYFFPGGQAQKAWVPVVDGRFVFTVVTEPFTGRARVVAGKVEAKE